MFDRLKRLYYRHQEQNVHALKCMLAFALAYFYCMLSEDPNSVWVLISVAVVMTSQSVVGQQMQKGLMRIFGTALGAILGLFAHYMLQDSWGLIVVVIVLAFVTSRFAVRASADFSYAAVLCMVTFSLLALAPQADLHFALMRVKDITIGVVIALLVSRFVFPLTSRRALLFEAGRNFNRLSRLIESIFVYKRSRREDKITREYETSIIKGLIKTRAILSVMRFESIGAIRFKEEYEQLVRYFRGLFHYLIFIDVALSEIAQTSPVLVDEMRDQLSLVLSVVLTMLNTWSAAHPFDAVIFDGGAFVEAAEKFQDKHFGDHVFQAQVGAICFALTRIPHCVELVVKNWNLITTPVKKK